MITESRFCCRFPVLVLMFVVYNRRREAHIKYPGPDDDVRENIINYDDEGGGEDDMTAFDITPLQIPIGGSINNMHPQKYKCTYRRLPVMRSRAYLGAGRKRRSFGSG